MRPVLGVGLVVLLYLVHFGGVFVAAQVALSRNWLRGKFSNEKTEMRIHERGMVDGAEDSWSLYDEPPELELRNNHKRLASFFSPEEKARKKAKNGRSSRLRLGRTWFLYRWPSVHTWEQTGGRFI